MKYEYCSDCEREVPKLDKDEFIEFAKVYEECFLALKDFKNNNNPGSYLDLPMDELFKPAIEKHLELTGVMEEDIQHIYLHHSQEKYVTPCKNCGAMFLAPIDGKCRNCNQWGQTPLKSA